MKEDVRGMDVAYIWSLSISDNSPYICVWICAVYVLCLDSCLVSAALPLNKCPLSSSLLVA